MNKRFVGVLIFAFVVASVASLLLYRFLASSRPQAAAKGPPVAHLVVAAKDLEIGRVLKDDDVKLVDWPGVIPVGAATRTQDLLGRGVIAPIYDKELILESRLAARGAGGGLASMIPPGMRAVAVRVNDVVGVAGFVTPGMRVDVLISGNGGGVGAANQGTITKTMLQNMEVLSAGQDYKKDNEGKPVTVQVVNLLVTPEQAEMLTLASTQTTIQLVLRNPMDREISKTPGTAMSLLFHGGGKLALPADSAQPPRPRPRVAAAAVKKAEPPVQPVKKEVPFVMQIISGNVKKEVTFTPPGGGK
jgi:pilus assembly protein CpaB